MINNSEKTEILRQIAQINLMERGKLTPYTFKDRSPDAPQHFKLQCWQGGKNHTRHVRPEELPLLQESLAGYAKFQELTDRLAQLIINDTREQLQQVRAGLKKRTIRSKSCWPKTKKSTT